MLSWKEATTKKDLEAPDLAQGGEKEEASPGGGSRGSLCWGREVAATSSLGTTVMSPCVIKALGFLCLPRRPSVQGSPLQIEPKESSCPCPCQSISHAFWALRKRQCLETNREDANSCAPPVAVPAETAPTAALMPSPGFKPLCKARRRSARAPPPFPLVDPLNL